MLRLLIGIGAFLLLITIVHHWDELRACIRLAILFDMAGYRWQDVPLDLIETWQGYPPAPNRMEMADTTLLGYRSSLPPYGGPAATHSSPSEKSFRQRYG